MTEPTALAQLRHLYQNMVNGVVRDTASAKRIAEGLLAPAIEALERGTPPVAQGDAEDAARIDWLEQQVCQSYAGVSFDYGCSVEGGIVTEKGYRFMNRHLLCDRMPTLRSAIDAARKQGANHD